MSKPKKYTFNIQAGAEVETRIAIAESYESARQAAGITDAMAWSRLIDWKEEPLNECGYCGENDNACKCHWTCSDCEQALSKQEFENNNDKYRPINKQPLCDRCVWNLRH